MEENNVVQIKQEPDIIKTEDVLCEPAYSDNIFDNFGNGLINEDSADDDNDDQNFQTQESAEYFENSESLHICSYCNISLGSKKSLEYHIQVIHNYNPDSGYYFDVS